MFFAPITLQAVIPNGQALSGAIRVGGLQLLEILGPAAWTAANLTFQGSLNGSDWFNVHGDTGTETAVTFGATRWHRLSQLAAATPGGLLPFGFPLLRLRSGTSATPVNQAGNRTLVITARQLQ